MTNRTLVRDRLGALGWRRGSEYRGNRVTPVEGRDLSSRQTQQVVRDLEIGNLSTPKAVQKLQTALHAKAKAEADYRFYALYDKISREDILTHAFAQCRFNKGAPGIDGQDFAEIETYGVELWLGELALALRQETYRPDPIRRVYIPKANGKLRPLSISTLRDRVCMTAARMGELLRSRRRHQSVPGDRQLHRCAVGLMRNHRRSAEVEPGTQLYPKQPNSGHQARSQKGHYRKSGMVARGL